MSIFHCSTLPHDCQSEEDCKSISELLSEYDLDLDCNKRISTWEFRIRYKSLTNEQLSRFLPDFVQCENSHI